MNEHPLARFWPLIHSIMLEFWGITEPHIEDAAVENDIPIELYFYSELGLEYFSVEEFQKRDPFSNPEQFEKMFARFDVKGWIIPLPDERYQVSKKAQEAVREIVQAGDSHLTAFDAMSDEELYQLTGLLKQLAAANLEAPEPPEKWGIIKRFRVAGSHSPLIVQIRELLLYLFAYRDDSHFSAAHPHFGQAGIVWNVLGSIANGTAVNAAQMAETMTFRGYDTADYEVAIQAAIEIGWVEAGETPNTFHLTKKGIELREQVEELTDKYFYHPWSVLTQEEIDTLYVLLTKLRDGLMEYRKANESNSHL
jgi:DNA-binding MarR family transcriptional regulator